MPAPPAWRRRTNIRVRAAFDGPVSPETEARGERTKSCSMSAHTAISPAVAASSLKKSEDKLESRGASRNSIRRAARFALTSKPRIRRSTSSRAAANASRRSSGGLAPALLRSAGPSSLPSPAAKSGARGSRVSGRLRRSLFSVSSSSLAGSMTRRTSPAFTCCPARTSSSVTTPVTGASKPISIFIASRMPRGWPASTRSPTST